MKRRNINFSAVKFEDATMTEQFGRLTHDVIRLYDAAPTDADVALLMGSLWANAFRIAAESGCPFDVALTNAKMFATEAYRP